MCGKPALLGTRSDQFPRGLIMTGLGVNLDLYGAVRRTSGGDASKGSHP
jgi:hypothetical protein